MLRGYRAHPQYRHRAPHTALFRSELLRRIGGYYAGLHLHFDSLLMNLVLMTGTSFIPPPLSITGFSGPIRSRTAPSTGFASRASWAERKTIARLYQSSFAEYKQYLRGQISSDKLANSIQPPLPEPADRAGLAGARIRNKSALCAPGVPAVGKTESALNSSLNPVKMAAMSPE